MNIYQKYFLFTYKHSLNPLSYNLWYFVSHKSILLAGCFFCLLNKTRCFSIFYLPSCFLCLSNVLTKTVRQWNRNVTQKKQQQNRRTEIFKRLWYFYLLNPPPNICLYTRTQKYMYIRTHWHIMTSACGNNKVFYIVIFLFGVLNILWGYKRSEWILSLWWHVSVYVCRCIECEILCKGDNYRATSNSALRAGF